LEGMGRRIEDGMMEEDEEGREEEEKMSLEYK
jgi:hypothetical protein